MSGNYDRLLTIFSPEGRLYQIEYASEAVKRSDLSAVAVRGKDCCVFVSQKKTDDPRMNNKLLDHTSVTRMFSITSKVGSMVVGSIADGRAVVSRARQEAAKFLYDQGYSMPAALVAKRLADLTQSNTQHAGARTMGVDVIICAIDDEFGPQIFKVDPSGFYLGYHAIAAGKLGQECNSILERHLANKPASQLDLKESLKLAVMALQEAAKVDFNAKNLEVAVVQASTAGRFEKLKADEIEQVLTEIAERD